MVKSAMVVSWPRRDGDVIDLIVPWERVDARDPTRFKEDPLKTDELRALFRSPCDACGGP